MLTKLLSFVRQQDLIAPGDSVVCAVSGGADSVALLFGLYLLREKLGITLSAAHFNHHLRGEESDRDEQFVRDFCLRYDIPLTVSGGTVVPGKKGLEAAAREARYAFLRSLPGSIATAHTADDNAETVLMHLIRGTGLKGLGGIAPKSGAVIRPMLSVTRGEVLAFLEEYSLPHVEDSSNGTDAFLRNRIRHGIMPLLKAENPRLAENLSAMALRLRADEETLHAIALERQTDSVEALSGMDSAIRSRVLEQLLTSGGVREPEAEHIALAEALIMSDRPSARADFSGGITLERRYGTLAVGKSAENWEPVRLVCPGTVQIPLLGLTVTAEPGQTGENDPLCFCIAPEGDMILRPRCAGDAMRLPGGTKSLKKLFIDRKIPASLRANIPVLADSRGVLGVAGIGANRERTENPSVTVRFMYAGSETLQQIEK